MIAHTGAAGGGGGYAERAAVSLDDTVAIPDGLDPLLAAAIIHDGPTALRIVRLVDVRPSEPVLVLGAAGGMGVLLVQLARARGARVIAAVRGSAKVKAVDASGADVVIDYGQPGWTSLVLDATGGSGPAVVLDGVGGQLGLDAYGIIADGGRFSAHGAPSGSFSTIDQDDARRRNVRVTGLGDLQIRPGERADLARQLLPEVVMGKIRPLIGQTFPLAEAARAHTLMEARQAIAKTLLIPVLCSPVLCSPVLLSRSLLGRSYSAGSLLGSAVTPRSRAAAEICRASSTSRALSPPTSWVDSHTTTLGYRRSTSGW